MILTLVNIIVDKQALRIGAIHCGPPTILLLLIFLCAFPRQHHLLVILRLLVFFHSLFPRRLYLEELGYFLDFLCGVENFRAIYVERRTFPCSNLNLGLVAERAPEYFLLGEYNSALFLSERWDMLGALDLFISVSRFRDVVGSAAIAKCCLVFGGDVLAMPHRIEVTLEAASSRSIPLFVFDVMIWLNVLAEP